MAGAALPLSIAIDGPAASGKTSAGRRLAAQLGYLMFDTGALYRALTLIAARNGVGAGDEPGLVRLIAEHQIDVAPRTETELGYAVLVDGEDVTAELRSPAVTAAVSPVSAHEGVRDAMLPPQRQIAERGSVVMVGRDIGTVVLPDADLKIYLDASVEARARRRFRERIAGGAAERYDDVRRSVAARDEIDSSRDVAPLRAAADSVVVDTDACDLDGVVRHLAGLVDRWPDDLTTGGGESPCGAHVDSVALEGSR
ncbi:MAG: (d)CMP kinase [Anaerolineae bacterium]